MEKMLLWFENVSVTAMIEMEDEISYRRLSARIACIPATGPIRNPCMIHQIHSAKRGILNEVEIEESFLQFLWCNAYSMTMLYYQGVEVYRATSQTEGRLDKDNPLVVKALLVSEYGSRLRFELKPELYWRIPNPELPSEEDLAIVEIVNEIYASAAAFCLLHEVGHQYYGHLDVQFSSASLLSDEFLADQYAAEAFKSGLGANSQRDFAICAGVAVAMISLLHLDADLNGDHEHPFTDNRVLSVFDILASPPDHFIWMFATHGLPIWIAMNGGPLDFGENQVGRSYREIFTTALNSITSAKR